MYAIIESSGKQYRLTAGDVLFLDKMQGNTGDAITIDKVLLVGGKENNVLVGKPYVSAAKIMAEIVDQDSRGEKILTIKYKKRKQYRRTIGHRSDITKILITKIEDGQGGSVSFDSAKRNEILAKANVKFSTRQEKSAAKLAPKTAKSAKPAKAAEATTTAKKAAPKKSTKAKA